jgi:hypothetical protein
VGEAVGKGVGVGKGVVVGGVVGVKASVGVGAGIGVRIGVGVGVGTGLTDRPQPDIRNAIRRRETARKRSLGFRTIAKHLFKTRFKLQALA